MRGVVTVATALAVPATVAGGGSFPHRGAVVVAALSCVMVTLVAQGLTLAPLAGRLKVAGDDDSGRELSRLRRRAAQAALDHVRDATAADDVADRVRRAAILQYEGFLSAQAAMEQARGLCDDDVEEATEQLGDVLASASAVERDVVLTARRRGQVSATSADEVLRDIEGRVLRDLG
jgi:CPA1 family monovalent cation:H+ antiporter